MILSSPAVKVQNPPFGPQQVLFATRGSIPALWPFVQRNKPKPSFLHAQGPRRAPRHFWPGRRRSIVVSRIGSCVGGRGRYNSAGGLGVFSLLSSLSLRVPRPTSILCGQFHWCVVIGNWFPIGRDFGRAGRKDVFCQPQMLRLRLSMTVRQSMCGRAVVPHSI